MFYEVRIFNFRKYLKMLVIIKLCLFLSDSNMIYHWQNYRPRASGSLTPILNSDPLV
jgi:hypothetical protein